MGVVTITKTPEDLQKIHSQLARPCVRPNNFAPRLFVGHASLLRTFKRHLPLKANSLSSLSYLSFILLSLSADVELNPGPVDFPCGSCAQEVTDYDPAAECDECGQRFHIQCQSFDQGTYDDWIAADHSFFWTCSNCDQPNFSNIAQSSFVSIESQNSFSVLSDETPLSHSRDPSPTTRDAQPRRSPSTVNFPKLRVLNINCRSLVNKKAETTRGSRCFIKYSMALLQYRCRHILSVPRESLAIANIILSVSARYLLVLIITDVRSIQ